MKTKEEVVADFWEEDQKYAELIQEYQGNEDALNEADWLYQEGVRVDEIAWTLREHWDSNNGEVGQVTG